MPDFPDDQAEVIRGKVYRAKRAFGEAPISGAASGVPCEPYDVAILGAGVVGCALAYELSQYELRVLLLDKNDDVGEGTSKANSAIIHTGFDASPGTLESRLVSAASHEWPELAERLKIPLRQTGALLLALEEAQARQLPQLLQKARDNGVDDVELLDAAEVGRLEPNAAPTGQPGLLVPRESVIDPFTVSIAFAEVAVRNGVDLLLGSRIDGLEDAGRPVQLLVAQDGSRIAVRTVVNVAGLGSSRLARAYGGPRLDLNPRRGQFLVYDKLVGGLIDRILLPVPTERTKGKLVAPTIFGNLLAGPTAEDLPLDDPQATSTTIAGLEEVSAAASAMCPALAEQRPIASYAGARCHCAQGSYQIHLGEGPQRGLVTVAGIRSTGLSASPTLAKELVERIVQAGWLKLRPDPAAQKSRPESSWPGWWKRPYADAARVAGQPAYGRIVCFCEQISEQELVDAIRSPLAPCTTDALKRRTRTLMGRCQGFNCLVRNLEVLGEQLGISLEDVAKHSPGASLGARRDAGVDQPGTDR